MADSPTPEERALAQELFEAVMKLARSMDHAPVEALRIVHDQVGEYLMDLIDRTPREDLTNAVEQRVLGVLWAELESALDERS